MLCVNEINKSFLSSNINNLIFKYISIMCYKQHGTDTHTTNNQFTLVFKSSECCCENTEDTTNCILLVFYDKDVLSTELYQVL